MKSIDKALDVLLLFSREENELAHAEIARRMGWTTSTASRIIGTLLERDFLSKNEDNGKYRLGNMVYYLGAIARGNSDMRSCALPVMQKINQITNETVHIFVRDGISRVCIEQVNSRQTIRMSCEIGVRDVLWIGNTGRVLMAFCEKQKERGAVSQDSRSSSGSGYEAFARESHARPGKRICGTGWRVGSPLRLYCRSDL